MTSRRPRADPYAGIPRAELVERRVTLRVLIRIERRALVAFDVPDKPWAIKWRERHAASILSRLAELEGELRGLDATLGPGPKVFRPRPVGAKYERALERFRKNADATAAF